MVSLLLFGFMLVALPSAIGGLVSTLATLLWGTLHWWPLFWPLLSLVASSVITVCLFSWLLAVESVQRPVSPESHSAGFLAACCVLVILQCATVAVAAGQSLNILGSYPVVTFSTSGVPNSEGREFLMVGSDANLIAVLPKPDPKKREKGRPILYISRSELKSLWGTGRRSVMGFRGL